MFCLVRGLVCCVCCIGLDCSGLVCYVMFSVVVVLWCVVAGALVFVVVSLYLSCCGVFVV